MRESNFYRTNETEARDTTDRDSDNLPEPRVKKAEK
jgi:hypothetical protein